MLTPDELRGLVESYLGDLALTPELGGLSAAVRYALSSGGKRIRPVICLATGQAAGAEPESLLPAGAAVELVHNFSLVHDDLPALDDDELRRGHPTVHVRFGEQRVAREERCRLVEGDVRGRTAPALVVVVHGREVVVDE